MYVPQSFQKEQLPILHDAIHRARLITLVTLGGDGLEATPLPMLLEPEEGPYGTLYGHLARANSQWQRYDAGVSALAMVLGPDAYVTPSWYESKQRTGKAVPTWNYIAVHAYGTLEVLQDAGSLRDIVSRLTARHEAGRPHPWALSDAPEDYVNGLLKAIVGIRLRIDRLEGKWKLSQNRSAEDRTGVLAGLRLEAGEAAAAVAAAMVGGG